MTDAKRVNRLVSTLSNTGVILAANGHTNQALRKCNEALRILKYGTFESDNSDAKLSGKGAATKTLHLSERREKAAARVLTSILEGKVTTIVEPAQNWRKVQQAHAPISTVPATMPLRAKRSINPESTIPWPKRRKVQTALTQPKVKFQKMVGVFQKLRGAAAINAVTNQGDQAPITSLLPFDELLYINLATESAPNDRNTGLGITRAAEVALYNMALLEYQKKNVERAVSHFYTLLRLLPTDDPATLDGDVQMPDTLTLACLNNMAHIFLQHGQFIDAKDVLLQALCIGKNALRSMKFNSLTQFLFREGDSESRKVPHVNRTPREQLALSQLAITLSNLAQAFFRMGSVKEALKLSSEALEMTQFYSHEKLSGAIHATTIHYNIGLIHSTIGNYERALDHYQESLEKATKLPTDHPFLGIVYHGFGDGYHKLGNIDEAAKNLYKSLQIRREAYMCDHEDIAQTLSSLASVLLDKEDFESAAQFFEDALREQTIVYGSNSLVVAATIGELGRIHHEKDALEESLAAYSEMLRILRESLGDKHDYIVKILNVIGNIRIGMGEIDEGVGAFSEAQRLGAELVTKKMSGEKKHVDKDMFSVVKNLFYNVDTNYNNAAALA